MITLKSANEISLAKIATVAAQFQPRVIAWYNDAITMGLRPYIYCGYRSNKEQDDLYKIGRELPGVKVTNAKAGQSFHNYGRAFDWVPLIPCKKSLDMFEADWDGEVTYNRGKLLGAKYNLRAISWETPHLEDGDFKDWSVLSESQRQWTSEHNSQAELRM